MRGGLAGPASGRRARGWGLVAALILAGGPAWGAVHAVTDTRVLRFSGVEGIPLDPGVPAFPGFAGEVSIAP